MKDYFEWDGTHLGDEFRSWMESQKFSNSIRGFCDCFHLKGCCSLALDGEKVRAGDRIYVMNGKLELVRGNTEPQICLVHQKEHTGTGPDMCIVTGEHT